MINWKFDWVCKLMTYFWVGFGVGFVMCGTIVVGAVMWLGRHFGG